MTCIRISALGMSCVPAYCRLKDRRPLMRLSRPAHLTPEIASLVTLGRAPRECGAARAEWSLERCPTASLAVFARLGQEPFGTCSRLADLRGATELQLIAYRPSLSCCSA